jgi:hypothetical protein
VLAYPKWAEHTTTETSHGREEIERRQRQKALRSHRKQPVLIADRERKTLPFPAGVL